MLNRLIRFRKDIVTLWHAFWDPMTPLYLKVLTVLTALYVLSPIDLVADFVPVLGWIDDVLIVSMMVSFIVSRLPRPVPVRPSRRNAHASGTTANGKVIDGTAREIRN